MKTFFSNLKNYSNFFLNFKNLFLVIFSGIIIVVIILIILFLVSLISLRLFLSPTHHISFLFVHIQTMLVVDDCETCKKHDDDGGERPKNTSLGETNKRTT